MKINKWAAFLLALCVMIAPFTGQCETDSVETEEWVSTWEGYFWAKALDDETCVILGYMGSDTDIVIPKEIDGHKVTAIGYRAFYTKSLTSVAIPFGVTSLGESSFGYCDDLVSVTLPSSLTEIDMLAFYGCDNLKNISVPEGVTWIGQQAFSYCNSLSSIAIPSGVTQIDYQTFYGCDSLTSITIPSSVTDIHYSVFGEWRNWNKKLVIYGEAGSCAEAFAKENEIAFSTDPMP